ncbi:MAG: M14 family zinc carboxypeptidase, partial [Nanoarchaeota archaeon]
MDIKDILNKVEDYDSFFTIEELDKRTKELSEKYDFELREVGKSEGTHSIYMMRVGNGSKKAFVWGFPHPNEPVGSLLIDFLINYFGNNPEKLKEFDYTWYFIYSIDPDGTKLNEGWFKGELTLKKYFQNFYRPSADRMIDWTFPIKYKDFEWNSPLVETKVLMKIMEEIKPDLMYPLHNSGFGGAYFFSTKKFENSYYDEIIKEVNNLGIPLHLGEPEEEFMVEIRKPFYFDFGFKEYYDYQVKLGRNPKEVLKHGDNSTNYLLRKNPSVVVIKGEVPYFYEKEILNNALSDKTRREIWLKMIEESDKNLTFYSKFIQEILKDLKEPDPDYYIVKQLEKKVKIGNHHAKNHVLSSNE